MDQSESLLLRAATRAQAVAREDVAAQAFAFVGQALAHEKRFKEAHLVLDLSRAAIERLGGSDDLEAFRLKRVASVLTSEERTAEAIPVYRDALALQQKISGADSLPVATLYVGLSRSLSILGRQEEALDAVRHGAEIYRRLFGPGYPTLADALLIEGHVLRDLNRKDEALAATRGALEARIRAYGPDHPAVVEALMHLGDALNWAGRPAEAVPILERCVATDDRVKSPYVDVPIALGGLGTAWLALGHPDRAAREFARSLAHPRAAELDNGSLGVIKLGFAKATWATGEHRRAIVLGEQARAHLTRAHAADTASDLAEAIAWLKQRGNR
jgi:tetratricopeptide (TPR) repeat protein